MSRTAWRKTKQEIERRGYAVVIEDLEKYEIDAAPYFNGKEYSVYHFAHNGAMTFRDCITTAYSIDGLEYLFVD